MLGVDACRKGWVGITDDERGYFGSNIAEVVEAGSQDGAIGVVAIDIPIGLPVSGAREADALARKVVGKRASSVFPTPVRAALTAASHSEATSISIQSTGKGMSQQAFALGRKILEVDRWALAASHRVIEVHPEVCFATMNAGPLKHSKSSWAGSEERRFLLKQEGLRVPSDIGLAGEMAGTDDVLDAAAAAWTARRYAQGRSKTYPATPEDFGDGHQAAIRA